MKLHYSKILLFVIPLNILAHNKNKPYITTRHTPITTSRVISESDIQLSNYDKDADIKSVKEIFDRQTSQRFEEYEERMKDKRQKRKEERDKNIKNIIEKDKMEKSLAEKIEKGCLRCGCGLGGVAASVGIFGAVAVNELTKAAVLAAAQKGIEAGIKAGIEATIAKIKSSHIFDALSNITWFNFINESNYNTVDGLFNAVMAAIDSTNNSCPNYGGSMGRVCNGLRNNRNHWFRPVVKAAKDTTASITESVEEAEIVAANATSTQLYSAIGYSVLAILIIALVMIIIYLVLRYRRKKKMKKKAQYTKLLNE
ncbi:rifin PIR protein, putative [Plasmodium reichenowi]|uniref:Rifin PIR protein, putative n=1 Tax=Plasmodium reichenowi TaxID=5854 RepID=A0A2P9DKT8_PLARE|nr:rifin PIR protein, putative [Plasmodium reichenowi]